MEKGFYIGWMPNAPTDISAFIRKWALLLLLIAAAAGSTLALLQKKFDSGNFEFGKLTQLKGVYFQHPVPALQVSNGNNLWGEPVLMHIPLIGYGKHGVYGLIESVEKKSGMKLDGKAVNLKGTLLYNDGKLLMQIDQHDEFLLSVNNTETNSRIIPAPIGEQEIIGEIVDPKCFFGVMKPGEGKPHKDCAIRCILGGIPPVLKVTSAEGQRNFYLMVGEDGKTLNHKVKDFVAQPVKIKAEVKKYGDWIVLYVQSKNITRYSFLREMKQGLIASCMK